MTVKGERPHALTNAPFHYCPGCTHGIVHRLVAEVIDELGIEGKTVGVASVGCSVFTYNYFNCDMVQAPHGRAPAVATGVKRARPENVVFTYQGDGDLAAIGMGETVHAAARGENIVAIFINNAIYGMTGGQMAPTTLPGQVTQTTPYGRDVKTAGNPIRVCELLSSLDGVALAERVTVDCVKNVRAAKKAIKKAFEYQMAGKGYCIVEVVLGNVAGRRHPVAEGQHAALLPAGRLQGCRGGRAVSDLNVLLTGFGGQGILFTGKVMAYASMMEGREISWLPSYGPEMRGGTASCSVCISDKTIGSPLVVNPDVLVAMNLPSLEKFEKDVVPGGIIIVDSSIVHKEVTRTDVKVIRIDASRIAEENGLKGAANMVILGRLFKETGFCSAENLDLGLQKSIPARKANLLESNRKAIALGIES